MKNFFMFSTIITVPVTRVLFVVGAIALWVAIGMMTNDDPLISLPSAIASIICWRVTLEMYVALVRIAENTTKLVEMKESKEA